MKELFAGTIIAAAILAATWVAWRILFVEEQEQRDRQIKRKGPVRIMTEIKPAAHGARAIRATGEGREA